MKQLLQPGVLLILAFAICFAEAGAEERPATAAIATANPLATRAGEIVIKQGGNAFDAAAAITAALAVVEPYSSGLGGGGLWLLYRAADGKQALIDGRELSPQLTHDSFFLDDQGKRKNGHIAAGAIAAAIPGIPAGIAYLAAEYGRLPLSQTLKPAMDYAARGFYASGSYPAAAMARKSDLLSYPDAAAIFLDQGAVPGASFWLRQKDLAQTLAALAEHGHAGFYQGPVAAKLVSGVNKYGGIWTPQDLLGYQVREREPISFSYHDVRIVAAPPPSAGGVVMGQALKILEHFDIQTMDAVSRMHYVVEAMRRAYRDYAVYLGDPDVTGISVQRLLHADYLEGLALTIDPHRATPSAELGDTMGLVQAGLQTTHFSVLDNEGNRVAATLSISSAFGSAFVPAGTGVLLNDAMNDFSLHDATGPVGSRSAGSANVMQPGKRPLSPMTPTFVETQDQVVILGTPGGNRIISMLLLAVLDIRAGLPLATWLGKPRYHHQYQPDVIEFEYNGLSFADQRKLFDMGHTLQETTGRYGDMQVIVWDQRNRRVEAASDPRGTGAALVYPD